jgi:hypothetical protein
VPPRNKLLHRALGLSGPIIRIDGGLTWLNSRFAIGYDRSIDATVATDQWEAGLMSQDDQSTQIECCIDRTREGDPSARGKPLAHASGRLTRLKRETLRDFPGVHLWEQTDDALENAVTGLCRVLSEVQPPPVADFFRLAAAR